MFLIDETIFKFGDQTRKEKSVSLAIKRKVHQTKCTSQVMYNKKSNNKSGKDLRNAIENAKVKRFQIKLSGVIDLDDALTMNVMYPCSCQRGNVHNVMINLCRQF